MNISQVLQFEGPIDSLVWKSPIEDFNTTSQLIVDETHEALLVVNGNACDLFCPGRYTLDTPNIPLVNKIINIPTNGQTPFPCKVFFINKVHQMNITWGIPGNITLNDPVYDIFLHVGMCGNMNFQIEDSRKFMLKIVGFRDQFDSKALVDNFRGNINKYVRDYISKKMNVEKISYFDMNENLFEVSEEVRKQLIPIFEDYGINVIAFSIESITVPEEDLAAVKKAKEARTSRVIQGYTWQEERQMDIAQVFAGNEGTMGNIGGAVGGFMMGGAFGNSVTDLARNALSPERIPVQNPTGNSGEISSVVHNEVPDQTSFAKIGNKDQQPLKEGRFCSQCGNPMTVDMVFCPKCGTKQAEECSNCHTQLIPGAVFCHKCGTRVN